MNYTHLSREERYQIHALRRRRVSIAAIAADLDRHRSTIARELDRNANANAKGHYHHPVQAHV
ncbi:MAG: helix-turn-helix domain-containing protein [Polaromonas sp.]